MNGRRVLVVGRGFGVFLTLAYGAGWSWLDAKTQRL